MAYYGYGGDFGEVVHDGNFVMDGMVLPDDTPSPGLAEFAAVNAPVTFRERRGGGEITNRQHTRSTVHLRFVGYSRSDGRPPVELRLRRRSPGDVATVALPVERTPPRRARPG